MHYVPWLGGTYIVAFPRFPNHLNPIGRKWKKDNMFEKNYYKWIHYIPKVVRNIRETDDSITRYYRCLG